MLHRICEFNRSVNKRLDYFIAEFKRFFIKTKVNKEEFKTKCSVSLPEFPILTRWGTWINCACYIFKNYAEILKFLKNETENFIYLSKMLKEVKVIEQLKIFKNFEYLIDSIKSLERNTSKTEDQIQILKVAKSIKNEKYDWLVEKVDTVIQKIQISIFS